MKSECIGIVGEWFGHRFESLLLTSEPVMELDPPFRGSTEGMRIAADATTRKTYKIVCVRCGEEKK